MTTTHTGFRRLAALSLAGLFAFAVAANAATITIVNNDGVGEGFNDATAVAPVGGNPGTTLGQQRLYIFQTAAAMWGSVLPSAVLIQVNSQFNPLTCTATSATLGSTGATTIHRDFAGAPYSGTWYVQSLANRLYGADLNTAQADMNSTFNSTLDNGSASCLGGQKWYYGVDGLEGTNVELLPVCLHEMAHGLGFMTTTSGSSGAYNSSYPSIYDRFLVDKITGNHWADAAETPAQRVTSAKSVDQLVWDGPGVTSAAPGFLNYQPYLNVTTPALGTFNVNAAAFGGALTLGGVTGDVVLMQDVLAPTSDGCETLVNGPALAGKIALVDRGVCAFVAKAESAQANGAIALIIANNAAGTIIPAGTDPAITIPVVSITQAQGTTLKTALGSGTVTVTVGLNPAQRAGSDLAGHVYMYTPTTFSSGSSVSHYDITLTPNALMEYAINGDLHNNLDLTPALMADIGWMDFATATELALFTANDLANGIEVAWQFAEGSDVGSITVERSPSESGPWAPVAITSRLEGERTIAFDGNVEPNATYFYRLSVMNHAGQVNNYGLASARHAGGVTGPAVLLAAGPNPATRGTALQYRISQPTIVHLSVVDASGRVVRSFPGTMQAPGTHTQVWDLSSNAGSRVASGLYFAVMQAGGVRSVQRIVVTR